MKYNQVECICLKEQFFIHLEMFRLNVPIELKWILREQW